jgi:hypothetical protein
VSIKRKITLKARRENMTPFMKTKLGVLLSCIFFANIAHSLEIPENTLKEDTEPKEDKVSVNSTQGKDSTKKSVKPELKSLEDLIKKQDFKTLPSSSKKLSDTQENLKEEQDEEQKTHKSSKATLGIEAIDPDGFNFKNPKNIMSTSNSNILPEAHSSINENRTLEDYNEEEIQSSSRLDKIDREAEPSRLEGSSRLSD